MTEGPEAEGKIPDSPLRPHVNEDPTEKPPGLIVFFYKRMNDEHISSAAAALTFSTVLALVPALALVLASLAAFPGFNDLREGLQLFIVNNLVPDVGLKINEALTGFIAAAGKLTLVGAIGLMTTAIVLLLTIEGQLNLIFHVTRPRPIVSRLLMFWAVMTVGPLLLGLGLSLFGYFSAVPFLENSPGGTSILLGHLLPTLLTWAAISFVFRLLPNRRMQMVDVLIGAAIAALLLAILRYTFAYYVVSMTSYQAIYGALAAFPVFLMWLYLIWFFVMIGAVVTAGLPDWRFARTGYGASSAARIVLAVEILAALSGVRQDGKGWTRRRIVKAIGAPDALVSTVLEILRAGRFVAHTDSGDWVVSRDLDRTTLADLTQHLGFGLSLGFDAAAMQARPVGRRLYAHMRSAAESERTLLSVSLARLAFSPDEQPLP